MSKNLKQQLFHAIEDNFREKQDKHSMKKAGYQRNTTIFSYSDRKNLIDTAAHLANWLRANGNPRFLYQLKPEQIQSYLNAHADKWTAATMNMRISHLRKLEILSSQTYSKSNIRFMGNVVMPATTNDSKRTLQVTQSDYEQLLNYAAQSRSSAKHSVYLAGQCGLRVSEIAKLKGSDIDIKNGKATIRIVDSKGKRSRTIILPEQHIDTLLAIKQGAGEGRICPVRADTINTYMRRAFQALSMTQYVAHRTSIHALRKLAAQRYFDNCREQGQSIKESLGATSVFLGHGKKRDELMRHYILCIN